MMQTDNITLAQMITEKNILEGKICAMINEFQVQFAAKVTTVNVSNIELTNKAGKPDIIPSVTLSLDF
jgi:hypothetical protein